LTNIWGIVVSFSWIVQLDVSTLAKNKWYVKRRNSGGSARPADTLLGKRGQSDLEGR
jgi:hypothetical protein